jgi:hypothetical protein
LLDVGIKVSEFVFAEGTTPSEEIIDKWLTFVDEFFSDSKPEDDSSPRMGVHCITG